MIRIPNIIILSQEVRKKSVWMYLSGRSKSFIIFQNFIFFRTVSCFFKIFVHHLLTVYIVIGKNLVLFLKTPHKYCELLKKSMFLLNYKKMCIPRHLYFNRSRFFIWFTVLFWPILFVCLCTVQLALGGSKSTHKTWNEPEFSV